MSLVKITPEWDWLELSLKWDNLGKHTYTVSYTNQMLVDASSFSSGDQSFGGVQWLHKISNLIVLCVREHFIRVFILFHFFERVLQNHSGLDNKMALIYLSAWK